MQRKYWFNEEIEPLRIESAKLKEMLKQCNVNIDGITPDLANDEIKRTKKFSLVKADEILLWVSEHSDSNWIVIDDLDLHNEKVAERQIRTDASVGLTETDIEKAKSLFRRGI